MILENRERLSDFYNPKKEKKNQKIEKTNIFMKNPKTHNKKESKPRWKAKTKIIFFFSFVISVSYKKKKKKKKPILSKSFFKKKKKKQISYLNVIKKKIHT